MESQPSSGLAAEKGRPYAAQAEPSRCPRAAQCRGRWGGGGSWLWSPDGDCCHSPATKTEWAGQTWQIWPPNRPTSSSCPPPGENDHNPTLSSRTGSPQLRKRRAVLSCVRPRVSCFCFSQTPQFQPQVLYVRVSLRPLPLNLPHPSLFKGPSQEAASPSSPPRKPLLMVPAEPRARRISVPPTRSHGPGGSRS